MLDITNRDILPALSSFTVKLSQALKAKTALGCTGAYEKETLEKLSTLTDAIHSDAIMLKNTCGAINDICDITEKSIRCKNDIIPEMQSLRAKVDEAQGITAAEYWPMPTYGELLFGV